MDVTKIDLELTRERLDERLNKRSGGAGQRQTTRRKKMLREMRQLQTTVYVMVGGGFIGRSAAQQPKDFYVDARVSRRPYPMKAITQAVAVLAIYAELLGFNPENIDNDTGESFLDHHNLGVF